MNLDVFNLHKKLVVITGGAGLLGRMHAEAIAEIEGVPVLLDINLESLQKTKKDLEEKFKIKVPVYAVDITQEDQLTEVLKSIQSEFHQSPYGLINNAAIDPKFDQDDKKVPKSRLEAFPLEQWQKELNVGLTGSFLCTKVFGLEMAKSGKGAILNISSDLGLIAPDQRLYRKEGLPEEFQPVKPITYSVIKHGLIGLTKYTASYWAQQGVRCNALAPGGVFNNHSEDFVNRISKLIPMGRMANRNEYKSSVQFLISDASSYMTGSVLTADGGRSVW